MQIRQELVIARVRSFVRGQVGPGLHDQSSGVDEPASARRFVPIHAVPHHGRHDEIGDADAGLASAQEHECLVREASAGDAAGAQQAGQRDRRGALDVVVEAADAVPVLPQEAKRVLGREVLELDKRFGEDLLRAEDELVH